MSEHRSLRLAIAAKLRSIPGIGQVHDYERYAASDADFRTLYDTGGSILGWHVRRVGRKEEPHFNEVLTDWEIRGFASILDDAESELAFDDLIDAIGDAWRADPKLQGAVIYPKEDMPVVPQLADAGPVMFAGVLCHSARLRLTTRHIVPTPRPWG